MATVEEFKVKVTTEGTAQLDGITTKVENLGEKFRSLSGLIAGIGFTGLVAGAIKAAEAIDDLSNSTGIAIGSILSFQKAVEMAGGKASTAERSITSFYGAIERAADGSLRTQQAFAKIGVTLEDLRNLSEAELLQKTIDGLSEMQAGSERTAVATELLSKAFRNVDPKTLKEALGTKDLSQFEESIKRGAAAGEAFEKAIGNIKLATLEAFGPLLKVLGDQEVGVKNATIALQVLAAVMIAAFGASVLANIVTINKALGVTVALGNLMGKTPLAILGRLAAIGGAAAVTAAAISQLSEENEKLAKTEMNTGVGTIKPTQPAAGPANRTVVAAVDPAMKARAESLKRIELSIAEERKNIALLNANDLEKIEINLNADILKARQEVYSKENLSKQQMDQEFVAKEKELKSKAALEIAQYRRQIDMKIASEIMAQAEQDARDIAGYYQQIDQARLSAFNQVANLKKANEEQARRQELELSILTLSEREAKNRREIFDLEEKRRKELEAIAKIENLPYTDRLEREKQINAEIDRQKEKVIERQDIELRSSRSFNEGWVKAYNDFRDSSENAFNAAGRLFNKITSGMEESIINFAKTGKFEFRSFVGSILEEILRSQVRQLLASLFGLQKGPSQGLFGGAIIPGFLAKGGPAIAGRPYVVGEKGPELFVPNNSGTVIPNGQYGTIPTTTITYNINAVDTQSFKQLIARDPGFIYSVTEQGRRLLPQTRR